MRATEYFLEALVTAAKGVKVASGYAIDFQTVERPKNEARSTLETPYVQIAFGSLQVVPDSGDGAGYLDDEEVAHILGSVTEALTVDIAVILTRSAAERLGEDSVDDLIDRAVNALRRAIFSAETACHLEGTLTFTPYGEEEGEIGFVAQVPYVYRTDRITGELAVAR